MPMMASISRISAGIGLSCGLGVWGGLALHICRRGQTHCHDQEEGPHRGGEIQRGKEKRRRRRGRLPTSREALKLTGELGDAWHLYAVTGCTTSCVQKPRARAAETLFFPQVDTSIARHLSQTSNVGGGSEVKRCNLAARLLLCSSPPT